MNNFVAKMVTVFRPVWGALTALSTFHWTVTMVIALIKFISGCFM